MSKLVPCAGLFNDYLDADGPDGADGPEECDQPPSSSQREIVLVCRKVLPRVSVQALQDGNDMLSNQEEEAPYASPPPSAAPETTATPHLFQVKQRLRDAVTLAVIGQNFRQKIRPI